MRLDHGWSQRRRAQQLVHELRFALPPVAFITWPTRKPNVCVLPPRYCATGVGVRRDHRRAIAPTIAPSSSICASPSAATMSSARAAGAVHLLEDVLGDRRR